MTVERLLKEAEDRLLSQDYIGAMASLESAWHLQPNDPEIVRMRERIQTARQSDTDQEQERKLTEARKCLLEGQDEQAFLMAQEVLSENATHKVAKALRDQILESRWQKIQDRITGGLELAIQPLCFFDFEVTLDLLTKLQNDVEIDSCRKEVERIRAAITALATAFPSGKFYDVSPIIRQLLARDTFGWLEPHRSAFMEIENVATNRLRDGEAILREAHQFAAHMNWEQAISCWNQALTIFPDSPGIIQAVTDAKHHVAVEAEMQKNLLRQLKSCYLLILNERWAEAQELTDVMLQAIQPGFRLSEIEAEIEALQVEIQRQNLCREKNLENASLQLAEASKLYQTGAYTEALEKVSEVMESGYLHEEALELKLVIEKAVQARLVAARFQTAVHKGKEYFEQGNWQKAIEFWKKACSLSDEFYVKEWIEQAETRWKKERNTRLSIIAMLAEANELIFYNKFTEAARKIEKCRKVLSGEFSFVDLIGRVNSLTEKLQAEIQKEEFVRVRVQSELEECSLLYQQKLYDQAREKVEEILLQYPELESAMQLKAQIEKAEAANTNVFEILNAVVKLVVNRDTRNLANLLLRLKETASHTPYAEDCQSIIDEMPLLVLEIESGDQKAVLERLDRLFSRSVLLLEYEQPLRTFVKSLETRNQKEAALEETLSEALHSLESGDRAGALTCLDRFRQVLTGKRKQLKQNLDKTATLSDDDLKLTELELETLQNSLLQHEVDKILVAAKNILLGGDPKKAQDLFRKALEIDPDNPIAREGLRQTQTD